MTYWLDEGRTHESPWKQVFVFLTRIPGEWAILDAVASRSSPINTSVSQYQFGRARFQVEERHIFNKRSTNLKSNRRLSEDLGDNHCHSRLKYGYTALAELLICFEALVGLMVVKGTEGNQTRVEVPGTYHENPGKTPGNYNF